MATTSFEALRSEIRELTLRIAALELAIRSKPDCPHANTLDSADAEPVYFDGGREHGAAARIAELFDRPKTRRSRPPCNDTE